MNRKREEVTLEDIEAAGFPEVVAAIQGGVYVPRDLLEAVCRGDWVAARKIRDEERISELVDHVIDVIEENIYFYADQGASWDLDPHVATEFGLSNLDIDDPDGSLFEAVADRVAVRIAEEREREAAKEAEEASDNG